MRTGKLEANERFLLRSWEYAMERSFEVDHRDSCTTIMRFSMYKHYSSWLLSAFRKEIGEESDDEEELLAQYRQSALEDGLALRSAMIARNGFYLAPEDLYGAWVEKIQKDCFDTDQLIASIRRVEGAISRWMRTFPHKGQDGEVEVDPLDDLLVEEPASSREARLKNVILMLHHDHHQEEDFEALSLNFMKLDAEVKQMRTLNEQLELYAYEALSIRRRADAVVSPEDQVADQEVERLLNGRYRKRIDYRVLPEHTVMHQLTDHSEREEASALLTAINQYSFSYFKKLVMIERKSQFLRLQEEMKQSLQMLLEEHLSFSEEQSTALFLDHVWTKSFLRDMSRVIALGVTRAVDIQEIKPVWGHKPVNRKLNIHDGKGNYIPMTQKQEQEMLVVFQEQRLLTTKMDMFLGGQNPETRKVFSMAEGKLKVQQKDINELFLDELNRLWTNVNAENDVSSYEVYMMLFEKWFGPLRDRTLGLYFSSLPMKEWSSEV